MTTSAAVATQERSLARIYTLEAKYEFLKLLRMPAYAIPAIAFPLLFYVFFGITFGGGRAAGPVSMSTYLLATYGAFGVIGASLFGFGVGVAIERDWPTSPPRSAWR
jgi:ABC-2 type transport system permease protein